MKTLIVALLLVTPAYAGPLSTYLVEPCRYLDTREEIPLPGISGAFTNRRVYRVQETCGVALGAGGVLMNVTVTGATVKGHLALISSEITRNEGSMIPTTSTLNFAPGQTVANFAITQLARIQPGEADLLVYVNVPNGQVHVIIDVVGYLR
mgnify:CR=1 FL=1